MKTTEHFRAAGIGLATNGVELIDRIIREGREPNELDRRELDRLAKSKLPAVWQSLKMARERDGALAPREFLVRTIAPRRRGLIVKTISRRPTLWLYGEVGVDFGASDVREALATIQDGQRIDVHIHSEGGSYLESIAIHSLLARRTGYTAIYIDGLAASGGSLIAMAGTSIEMASGSWMMIHGARGSAKEFTHAQFTDAGERLGEVNRQMLAIYATRWTGTQDELRDALADELWLSAEQAVARGLADRVGTDLAVAARFEINRYANVPPASAIAARNASATAS